MTYYSEQKILSNELYKFVESLKYIEYCEAHGYGKRDAIEDLQEQANSLVHAIELAVETLLCMPKKYRNLKQNKALSVLVGEAESMYNDAYWEYDLPNIYGIGIFNIFIPEKCRSITYDFVNFYKLMEETMGDAWHIRKFKKQNSNLKETNN